MEAQVCAERQETVAAVVDELGGLPLERRTSPRQAHDRSGRWAGANHHIVVLGGGHGVASVLRAVRDRGLDLTVVVTVADDGGSSGELRRRWGGPAVGDMRRSLITLVGDDALPARMLARRVTIKRFGEHPLGNLVLRSLTDAFGDLETAGDWLCRRLSVSARVLPATAEPVCLLADTDDGLIRSESAISATPGHIRRLRFEPERPKVPPAVIESIQRADWVLLGPGSLYTSVLAVCALPDIRLALARTRAHVLWICNLEPEHHETSRMAAVDHLAALRDHGVRLDEVLYDPRAHLHLAPSQLSAECLSGTGLPLRSGQSGRHDRVLLGEALDEVFDRMSA